MISQVYGGGGNAGATLRNDYIELFNHGLTALAYGTDQPVMSTGDGRTATDWQVLDGHSVLLRSERSGKVRGASTR